MPLRVTSPSLSQSLDQIDARLSRGGSTRVLPRPVRWGLHAFALGGTLIAGSVPAVFLAWASMLMQWAGLPTWAAFAVYGLGVLAVALFFVRCLNVRLRTGQLDIELALCLAGLVLLAPVVWLGTQQPMTP